MFKTGWPQGFHFSNNKKLNTTKHEFKTFKSSLPLIIVLHCENSFCPGASAASQNCWRENSISWQGDISQRETHLFTKSTSYGWSISRQGNISSREIHLFTKSTCYGWSNSWQGDFSQLETHLFTKSTCYGWSINWQGDISQTETFFTKSSCNGRSHLFTKSTWNWSSFTKKHLKLLISGWEHPPMGLLGSL